MIARTYLASATCAAILSLSPVAVMGQTAEDWAVIAASVEISVQDLQGASGSVYVSYGDVTGDGLPEMLAFLGTSFTCSNGISVCATYVFDGVDRSVLYETAVLEAALERDPLYNDGRFALRTQTALRHFEFDIVRVSELLSYQDGEMVVIELETTR